MCSGGFVKTTSLCSMAEYMVFGVHSLSSFDRSVGTSRSVVCVVRTSKGKTDLLRTRFVVDGCSETKRCLPFRGR